MKKRTRNNTIEVAVRVRPQLQSNDTTTHTVPPAVRAFSYPSTVVIGSDQSASFDAIGAPLLRRMSQGYNTTLLAYGQTGSGKTYTMFGPTGSLSEASLQETVALSSETPELWGIFPRIAQSMVEISGNLKASAVEVYNEAPFDLLNGRNPLQLSRSENAAPSVARVTSKRRPEGGSQFSNGNVGLNGEHPPACSCHECFKAQEAAKEARTRKIALARGEVLPSLKDGGERASNSKTAIEFGTLRQRRTDKSPKNKFIRDSGGSGSSAKKTTTGEARTVGETLWDLKTAVDVAKFARQIETVPSESIA
jgi:hypothetical protein